MENFADTNYPSDNELIIQLIDAYWLKVQKLAFTYVKDMALAEDITQEVFISCFKNLNNFRGESSYKTWIFRIAVNKCKDVLRGRYFKVLFLNDDVKDKILKKEKSAEHIFLQKSYEEVLSKLIFSLPLKYREVIILFYYEELKLEEITSLLEININTLKSRLKRGKALLRKGLERSGW